MTPGVPEAPAFGRTDVNRLQRDGSGASADGSILIVFVAIQLVCIAGALMFPAQFRYLASGNISVMLQAIPTWASSRLASAS